MSKLILQAQDNCQAKTYKDITRKETFRPVSLIHIEIKILHVILAHQIQRNIK